MFTRSAVGVVLAVAFSGIVAMPAAAAKAPASDGKYCYDVSFSSSIPAPPPGQVATQQLVLGHDCRLHAEPIAIMNVAAMPASDPDGSAAVDAMNAKAAGPTAVTYPTYRAYAVSRVWDAANILLTEYWTENSWTSTGSTGYIWGWGAVDGAKWHREFPGWTGWYPDTSNHFLGLTAGGLYYNYETVKGKQGFGYQGVLDPTGAYFYNRLTNWITGNRNGTWSCTQEVYLQKVPLFPLEWHIQRWCGSGYYPYK
jgi:hypothetical protein